MTALLEQVKELAASAQEQLKATELEREQQHSAYKELDTAHTTLLQAKVPDCSLEGHLACLPPLQWVHHCAIALTVHTRRATGGA